MVFKLQIDQYIWFSHQIWLHLIYSPHNYQQNGHFLVPLEQVVVVDCVKVLLEEDC